MTQPIAGQQHPILEILGVWAANGFAWLCDDWSLQKAVLFVTLIYTVLRTWYLIQDRRRGVKTEKD